MDLFFFGYGCGVALCTLAGICVVFVVYACVAWKAREHRRTRLHDTTLILTSALLWSMFLLLGRAIGSSSALNRFDAMIVHTTQNRLADIVLAGMETVTQLGDRVVLTGVTVATVVAVLSARRYGLALMVGLSPLVHGYVNEALKATFQRSRPEQWLRMVDAHGFAFPSGHTSASMVCYGLALYALLRCLRSIDARIAVCVGGAIVMLVGASRVALGVHFPSDVIGGCLSGAAWLTTSLAIGASFGRSDRFAQKIDAR